MNTTIAKAFIKLNETLDAIFNACGFVKGLDLNYEQIRNEQRPIFWHSQIPSKDASEKASYIIYRIKDIETPKYENIALFKYLVVIEFYSRDISYINNLQELEKKTQDKQNIKISFLDCGFLNDYKLNYFNININITI